MRAYLVSVMLARVTREIKSIYCIKLRRKKNEKNYLSANRLDLSQCHDEIVNSFFFSVGVDVVTLKQFVRRWWWVDERKKNYSPVLYLAQWIVFSAFVAHTRRVCAIPYGCVEVSINSLILQLCTICRGRGHRRDYVIRMAFAACVRTWLNDWTCDGQKLSDSKTMKTKWNWMGKR